MESDWPERRVAHEIVKKSFDHHCLCISARPRTIVKTEVSSPRYSGLIDGACAAVDFSCNLLAFGTLHDLSRKVKTSLLASFATH